jgi:hypothetical protein
MWRSGIRYVINKCYGGFGLSYRALLRLHELGHPKVVTSIDEWYGNCSNKEERVQKDLEEFQKFLNSDMGGWYGFCTMFTSDLKNVLYWSPNSGCFGECERGDPLLVQVVEELGEEANGPCSSLVLVEVPDDVVVEINDYDGMESIKEASRYFG